MMFWLLREQYLPYPIISIFHWQSDGVEQTRVLAEQHSKAAIRSLKDFSTSDSKNGLISLANMLLDRKKWCIHTFRDISIYISTYVCTLTHTHTTHFELVPIYFCQMHLNLSLNIHLDIWVCKFVASKQIYRFPSFYKMPRI